MQIDLKTKLNCGKITKTTRHGKFLSSASTSFINNSPVGWTDPMDATSSVTKNLNPSFCGACNPGTWSTGTMGACNIWSQITTNLGKSPSLALINYSIEKLKPI